MEPIYVLVGALTGLLVGLTGVGGGAIMTPTLISLGIPPLTAIGTDLWCAAITKIAGSSFNYKQKLIDWSVARLLWSGSIPTSLITLVWLNSTDLSDSNFDILKISIAVMMLLTSLGLIFQYPLHAIGREQRINNATHFRAFQKPLTVIGGSVLGLAVTLTSVGAGALGVVLLSYLYPLRLTPMRLVATDIVHAIPLAIFAGVGHLFLGNVLPGLLLSLLAGSLPAVLLGSKLSMTVPQPILRKILSVIVIIAGANLLRSAL